MAAQKGKDLLIKVDQDGTFITVAGLRAKRLAFNAETVDITDAESSGRWRELLEGTGVQRASISGSGIFKDADSDELVRSAFFNGNIKNWEITIPGFGVITGLFQLTSLEYSGQHNGEISFEAAMESAGLLSFGAV